MERNFFHFCKVKINFFSKAAVNIFIFLPYYFSVIQLLKTLFKPWKRIVFKKSKVGFSLKEWLEIGFANLVSCTIGFIMRFSLLCFYLIFQLIYLFFLPLIFLIFIIILPFLYLISLFQKTEEEKKQSLKKVFIENHCLKEENLKKVEEWFEIYWQLWVQKKNFFELKNLFSIPPLARDWSAGYTPNLDQYGEELTRNISYFKTLIDREKEISQIEQILSKTQQANVIIVGEEGVGKHTIVEALAKRIYEGQSNPILAYRRLFKIDIEKIIAQTTDFIKRENLLKEIFKEAEMAGNVILFIDNFERYVGGKGQEIDFSIIIGEFAKSSHLQFIGVTTPFFYQKFIYPNERIYPLFEKVDVYEISKEEAEKILLEKAFEFEKRFKVSIFYETIKEIIEKSQFFITDIPFPEKAIVLLDEAFAVAKQNKIVKITPSMIDQLISQKTHIPVIIDEILKNKLLNLEKYLQEKIVFQQEAIQNLASTIRRSFVIFSKRKKPLASFLFLGPTGVGKTQTAKALTEVFFGSEKYLLRFDMSFYQQKSDIDKLLGSITSGEPGILAQAIRQHPYGVLLLDEIEKADPDLLNIFLTLLDEGYLTDGFGKKIDCKNLIIIATSNAGSDLIFEKGENLDSKTFINFLISQKIFTPEFLNRFDGIVVYRPLSKQAIKEIAKKIINQIIEDVRKIHKIEIKIDEEFIDKICEKGYDPQFGARNLERIIRQEIEDKISRLILSSKT